MLKLALSVASTVVMLRALQSRMLSAHSRSGAGGLIVQDRFVAAMLLVGKRATRGAALGRALQPAGTVSACGPTPALGAAIAL